MKWPTVSKFERLTLRPIFVGRFGRLFAGVTFFVIIPILFVPVATIIGMIRLAEDLSREYKTVLKLIFYKWED